MRPHLCSFRSLPFLALLRLKLQPSNSYWQLFHAGQSIALFFSIQLRKWVQRVSSIAPQTATKPIAEYNMARMIRLRDPPPFLVTTFHLTKVLSEYA